jgi:cyclic pyranopterin phosphate synthase
MPERGFTHLDPLGRARMVDVTPKDPSHRRAIARGRVHMDVETASAVARGAISKGDVLAVARVAGIQAAKRTPDLIPLCHPLAIEHVSADIALDEQACSVTVTTTVATTGRTGVEMEALTAATAGALAVYDMVKGQDGPAPVIERVVLLEKTVDGQSRGTAPA